MKIVADFFLAFIPISIFFLSIALVRLFGVQDIGNVITTFNLGGVFSFNSFFIPTLIKMVVICPAFLSIVIVFMKRASNKFSKFLSYSLLLLGVIVISLKIFIGNVEQGLSGKWSSFFDDNYDKPNIEDFYSGDETLNIIWIYSESTEKRYRESKIIRELDLATNFMEEVHVHPLINKYTIGAVVSSRCAAPLFTGAISQNVNMLIPFSSTMCFDDILRLNKYHSDLIVGHDAGFSSIGAFFKFHGNSNVLDSNYISQQKKIGNPEHIHDEVLLEFSLERIIEIHKSGKKFSTTILTYDNHAPNGFPSGNCIANYGLDISGVIQCNSDLLASFISKLKESGILNDTVLIVLGDHPFMGKFPNLSKERDVFSKIYTPFDIKLKTTSLTPFDLPKTMLHAMGFRSEKETFGLGYSGYEKFILGRGDKWNQQLSNAFDGPPPSQYIELHKKSAY